MIYRYSLFQILLTLLLLASIAPRLHAQGLNVYLAALTDAPGAGDAIDYTLVVSNTGATPLNNVHVDVRLPDQIASFSTSDVVGAGLNCGNTVCSPGETVAWEVGTLAPGQSRTMIMPTSIANNAQQGTFLLSPVVATATGSNEVVLYNNVLAGMPVNVPPAAAVITSPANDTTIVIGGAEGEDPEEPGTPFIVEWDPSSDPEGDPLTYIWQLSASQDFSGPMIDEPSADGGAATRFEADFGTLAGKLTAHGVDLYETRTFYHRVVTSDGTHAVASDTFSIVLTRGTIVSTEGEAGLPERFALHGNYPNPFNPTTTFRFDLPEPAQVKLTVYDAMGRKVATLVSERLLAGMFRYEWEAGHLPSGVYFYRLQAGAYTKTKKLILLK